MTSERSIDEEVAGLTVPAGFLRMVEAHGDQVALRWCDAEGVWRHRTFAEYARRVAGAVDGLRRLGVGPGQRVVFMMRNIPEFHVLDLAACFCGATPISLYNSSPPQGIEYVVRHSGAVLAVVEDEGFLDRFLAVRNRLPSLEHLVVLSGSSVGPGSGVLPAEALEGDSPSDLHAAAAPIRPEDTATIIYTSGTTGDPKGVLLSHRNIVWGVESLRRASRLAREELVGRRVISYLPMAHIAERMTSQYEGVLWGYDVTTCPETARLPEYLRHVRPQTVFGVPRMFEKLQAGVEAALAADPERRRQFHEAVEAAAPIAEALDRGTANDEQRATYEFLDQVAFRPLRQQLGLDACDFAVSGAAPLGAGVLRWFRTVGIPLSELYGLSETCGLVAWTPSPVKPGSVGPAMPGIEVRTDTDGELLVRGGDVFGGYLDDPEHTARALDADGWLHTGDIGTIDEDGYVTIVDRKKELIITAGGKNVSPLNLEAALKRIDLVDQACAVGDRQPFVAALVTLDRDVAPAWAGERGIAFSSLGDLAVHGSVVDHITTELEAVMAGFSSAEKVKKVVVLGDDWQPDTDVLTPTSKLKRREIHARYASVIDGIYDGGR